jgi:hypothetical protein
MMVFLLQKTHRKREMMRFLTWPTPTSRSSATHPAKTDICEPFIYKNYHFEPFIYKNDNFAKTGSGQT